MNTNEASLSRTTVQTYSSRQKRAFDGVLFSMECTARWLENACDPMQAASEIRLAMAELRNCIADCEVIADAGSRQEEVEHIASVYEDKDGTKYVQFDIEDAEDIPVGTKLYPVARTLTRREIEEIAGYVEDECKACSGMTTLYIAAEAAVEETLRRIASPVPAQSAEQDERAGLVHLDDWWVDLFAKEMKDKLAKARDKGRGGWQDCAPESLSHMLREHVDKGDPRDVANFCMFLWALRSPISAATKSTATQQAQTQVALTDEQISIVRRLHMHLEAGRFANGVSHDRMATYAEALGAILRSMDAQ
jgi:hypothetical protein